MPLSHAVLGVGGVGATTAVLLAMSGASVRLIMRDDRLKRYEGDLSVDGAVTDRVAIPAMSYLDSYVDVLWVATKAFQLRDALTRIDAHAMGGAVVPLLNGVDHLQVLRAAFGTEKVIPGAIRMHAEKVDDTQVRFYGWHTSANSAPLVLAPSEEQVGLVTTLAKELDGYIKIDRSREPDLIWGKIADLATLGAASCLAGSMGEVRTDPYLWSLSCGAVREVVDVAGHMGARLDQHGIISRHEAIASSSTSSLYRDLISGRVSEVCAILDPPIREGIAADLGVGHLLTLRQLIFDRYGLAFRHGRLQSS